MNIKNIGRGNTVRTLVVGAGVLATVAVVGCGTQSAGSQNAGGPGSQTVGASAPSNTNTGTGSSTSDSSASSGATGNTGAMGNGAQAAGAPNAAGVSHPSKIGGVPECKANTLALSFGGADAGMSQQYHVLRFTNTGKTTCAMVGWPGVSYVTGDNGQQLGAPAVRNGKKGAQVNLAPGAVASTVIHSVDTGVYDGGACQPTPVKGYRIYAPDDTASMFIALPAGSTGCANPADTGLGVVTIRPGLGSPQQYQS